MSTTKNNKNKFFAALNMCLVVILIMGALYFLKSMDDLMVKNLELEQLKLKLNYLQEERQEMESVKNNLESYENISSKLKDLNMVKVANIDYINAGEDSLAKK